MKNILLILVLSNFLSLKAQSPIFPVYGSGNFGDVENAYYKDTDNFHNQYVGTWIYTNGNTSLKVVFVKKDQFYKITSNKNFYADYLIGEYQYVENGIEKVNTLSNLNVNHAIIFDYNLYSVAKTHKRVYPGCTECGQDEKRLLMELNEPSRRNIDGFDNSFVIRRFEENGVVKLKVWFAKMDNGIYFTKQGEPTNINRFSLPYGEYILTKQQ